MSAIIYNYPIPTLLFLLAWAMIGTGYAIRYSARNLPSEQAKQRRKRLALPLLGCAAFVLLIPLWIIGSMIFTALGVYAVCQSASSTTC